MRTCPSIRLSLLLFVVALLVVGPLRSQAKDPPYLTETSVDWKKLLAPPPSANSDEQRAELDLLKSLQTTRTDGQLAQAKADAKINLATLQPILGAWFTDENLPKLSALAKKTIKEAKTVADASKEFYGRARPAVAKPAVEGDTKFAYPSGHSTYGTALCTVLCEVCPEKKDALLERGREIGWNRVVLGLHFPSDVVAGRVLGQAVAQALLSNEQFQKDLAEAKAEFESVRAANDKKVADKSPEPAGAK